jgi:glycosyltransferase involved in cell wall biosynthesis
MLRSIVLPAYNEAGYIGEMVHRTVAAASRRTDPFEVIVVDNASVDDTAKIVRGIAEEDDRVTLIQHPTNLLYATSCLTGTRSSRGDRIFILDSDGQHAPDDASARKPSSAWRCRVSCGFLRGGICGTRSTMSIVGSELSTENSVIGLRSRIASISSIQSYMYERRSAAFASARHRRFKSSARPA